jgi:signal-transduction protein with cAMP-binding, CBS, and nucleotidyltransferase domain
MTNRKIADIVKDKKFLVLPEHQTVQEACRCMWESGTGAVLVFDSQKRLTGIFTGRDAVRTLAQGRKPEETTLSQAMTADPITISPENRDRRPT